MILMLPIISALLYRAGGTEQWEWCPINQKMWRWLGIGLFIGTTYAVIRHSWIPLLAVPAYALAIQIGQYGERSWLNFLGENGKFFVCGFVFGAASFTILPISLASGQSLLSGFSFLLLKKLDDKDLLKNPWIELFRGFTGTILLCFG